MRSDRWNPNSSKFGDLDSPVLKDYRREIIRQTDSDATTTLTVAQSGVLVLLDEDTSDNWAITLPAITSVDIGVTYEFFQTVASNYTRTVTTAYDNDYFIGGVVNVFDAAGDTDVLVGHVSTGSTDTSLRFDDNDSNAGGGVGARVVLTAILAGNTASGGGSKFVLAVSGNKVAQAITDTGADFFQ